MGLRLGFATGTHNKQTHTHTKSVQVTPGDGTPTPSRSYLVTDWEAAVMPEVVEACPMPRRWPIQLPPLPGAALP